MEKKPKSGSVPIPMMVFADFLGFLLSVLPVSGTWAILFYLGRELYGEWCFIAFVLLLPWLACLVLTALIFCIRLCFPRLRPGVYAMGANAGFLAWILNFYISRAVILSGLKSFVYANNVLRFLYFRAMGAKIAFQNTCSLGVDVRDLPLIEMGPGCTCSEGVRISGHTFTGEKLWAGAVKIEANVFLGMDVVIGPGTTIGQGSWIGTGNKFLKNKIAPETKIDNFEWEKGRPEEA